MVKSGVPFLSVMLAVAMAVCALSAPAMASPLKKAEKAYKEGEWERARALTLKGLEKEPDDPELRWMLMQLDLGVVRRAGTIRAYEGFIKKWKRGPLVDQARSELEFLRFSSVERSGTVTAWERFSRAHPRSELGQVAAFRAEQTAWGETEDDGSREAYEAFASERPDSPYSRAAKDRLADMDWVDVVSRNTETAYLEFLRAYPGSPLAGEAARRSEDLAWSTALEANTVDSWRTFRTIFHGTERAERAFDRERDLAWVGTLNRHEVTDYRAYETTYPQTREALDAEKREWDLYHFERDLFGGELRSSISKAHRQENGTYTLWFDVLDGEDNLVGGLQESNFKVYDAGYRGEVLEVLGMEHNRPVDVVFVVDMSGSMVDEIEGVKEGIARFASIMTLRSRDMRLGLVTFIEEVVEVNGMPYTGALYTEDLTDDVPTFLSWVSRIDTNLPGANEHHYMAIDAARRLDLRSDSQKVVVLLSDEDVAGDSVYNRDDLIQTLRLEELMIYTVTPDFRNFRTVSTETYGQWFELPRHGSFAPIMDALAQKISKQYKMTYKRPLEAPAVRGDLDVVVRIRTDQAWLADASASSGTLVFDASDASRVYALRADGGLLCSRDGGKNWSECGAGLPLGGPLQTLLASNQLTALAADGTVLVSSDGGSTFTPADTGAVAATSANTAWGGTLVGSSDGSLSWLGDGRAASISSPPTSASITSVASHPTESFALISTTDSGIFRTEDAGRSWQAVQWPHPTPPDGFAFHPTRAGLAFGWSADGLARSLDSGQTWHDLDPSVKQVNQLLFDPTVRRMVLALTDTGVMASDDLGRTWFDQNSGLKEVPQGGTVSPEGHVVLNLPGGQSGLTPVANREFVFSQLYYGSGAVKPGKALLPHLADLAAQMQRDRSLVLRIEGHADSDGSKKMNQKLSEQRAEWVADHLASLGVSSSRLVADGYGEERPLFANTSRRNKSRNRRVELVLVRPGSPPPIAEGMR